MIENRQNLSRVSHTSRLTKWLGITLLGAAFTLGGAAFADYTIKDGGGVTRTVLSFVCVTSKICPAHVNIDSSGNEIAVATSAKQDTLVTALGSPFQAGGSIGNTSFAVTNAGTFAVQLTGATNNINNISGTVSLPTLAATSTKQSDGSQKSQIVDGSGNVIASTSNNLNVQCANCSGSGASAADEATFTAGTSVFAPGGGFFQTTATANALTNGQQGMWQMTANRAGFVNMRNAAGAEIGVAAVPIQVSVANTGANANKLLVTPDSVALPANQSVNVSQINGVTALMGNGVTGTGSQRVTIASDNTAFSVNATLAAETTKVIGTVNQGTSPWITAGGGTAGTAATGVVTVQGIASMTKLLVTPDSVALPANQSVNVAQFNGVTPLMGNGASGTGAQRVSVSNDSTAIAGWGHVATGAAPPAGAAYIGANTSGATGGLVQGLIQCDSTAIYDASTNGSTELVALTSGRTIYVCGYAFSVGGTATNVKLIYGTGTACATGPNNMTPAYQIAANGGMVDRAAFAQGLKTASANALCINTSAGNAVQGIVYYAKL